MSMLSGLRILDLSRVLAGPYATQLLADFGAEVIKVERPGKGDDARQYGPPFARDVNGEEAPFSAMFVAANRNKRSIAIDFSNAEGREIVRQLAQKCDVLVENYKVGDLARHGLDYETLSALNPRLVYCSVTGFGQSGPDRHRPAYDSIFQALSGLMEMTGLPDDAEGGGPMKVGPSISDVIGGLFAATSILAAIRHRDATGTGQHIDVSLLDCTIAACTHSAQHYLLSGELPVRRGTEGNGGVPSRVYRCSDGDVFIVVGNDAQFARFCKLLGRPEWINDPRFTHNAARSANRAALVPLVAEALVGWCKDDLLEALQASGIPAAPIANFADVFSSEHAIARKARISASDAEKFQSLDLIANPVAFSATPVTAYRAPPSIGEHGDEILRDILRAEPGMAAAIAERISKPNS